jgi:hypothetical protein
MSELLREVLAFVEDELLEQALSDNPEAYSEEHRRVILARYEDLKRRAGR